MRNAIAVFVLLGLWAAPTSLSADATVTIGANGFTPSSVSIEVGEKVTWTNSHNVQHRVVVTGTQCNLTLQPNQSSSCTFNSPGTLNYSDPGQTGTGFKGTITVTRTPARSVTIDAPRNVVIFGGAITLSGMVTSGQAGEKVTITAEPMGEPARRIELTTTAGGSWSLRVQPRIETKYAARWRNATSPVFTALVRPRISLRKVGRNLFSVVVVGARSFADSYVLVQQQRSLRVKRLVTVRRVFLNENPRTETISQSTFGLRVPRGFRMRAFMPASQVGPGYLAGQSNLIRA